MSVETPFFLSFRGPKVLVFKRSTLESADLYNEGSDTLNGVGLPDIQVFWQTSTVYCKIQYFANDLETRCGRVNYFLNGEICKWDFSINSKTPYPLLACNDWISPNDFLWTGIRLREPCQSFTLRPTKLQKRNSGWSCKTKKKQNCFAPDSRGWKNPPKPPLANKSSTRTLSWLMNLVLRPRGRNIF